MNEFVTTPPCNTRPSTQEVTDRKDETRSSLFYVKIKPTGEIVVLLTIQVEHCDLLRDLLS